MDLSPAFKKGKRMKSIILNAYAKINLSIDVLGKRPDGYHEVLMVMQQVNLFDKVSIAWDECETGEHGNTKDQENKIQIDLTTNLPYLPLNDKNIAYQAAQLMCQNFKPQEEGNVIININKKIPVAAGLAGGSANAAAVIHGLAKLWELNLTLQQLMDLGVKLGADVPFCIMGQAALNSSLGFLCNEKENDKKKIIGTCAIASGIGEKLEVIDGIHAWVVLSKPPISVSTAKVYGGLNLQEITQRPNTAELVQGLQERNYHKILKNLINVLENVTLKEYPIIMYTKNKIEEQGKGHKALMSGSGPTIFSLYANKNKAKITFGKLKDLNNETFLVKCL